MKLINIILLLLLLATSVTAITEIDLQGRARNATNNSIVLNGSYTVNVTFTNLTGGQSIYSSQSATTFSSGIFNYVMDVTSVTLSRFLSPIEVQVSVAGDQMNKVNVTHSVKSLVSLLSNDSIRLNGQLASFYATASSVSTLDTREAANNVTQAGQISNLVTDLSNNATKIDNTYTGLVGNASKLDNLVTGNTTAQIISSVNNTALNGTNFKSLPCSEIIFDNGKGSAGICDGTDDGGSTGNTTEQIQDAVWSSGIGTQTRIAVTYQDGSDNVDFIVTDMSNTTQQMITAVNGTALNGTNFFDYTDVDTYNTSQQMINSVNNTAINLSVSFANKIDYDAGCIRYNGTGLLLEGTCSV